MMITNRNLALGVLVGLALSAAHPVFAQQQPDKPASPPRSAKAAANIDLTGWWVAYVTEDWRWRMVTPPKFDYSSVPLNHEGLRVSDTWDWQKDQGAGLQCMAYGAAGLMRIPTRVHISWQDENTLKVETDAGTQVRVFSFGGKPYASGSERTWQGVSVAEWEPTGVQATSQQILAIPPDPPSYALKVVTTGLRAGYLRTNGVPYSENTVLTEYYDTLTHTNGQEWLIITTVVDDPKYLQQPFITTTHFKREADGSRWHPTPCEITAPPRASRPVPPNGYLPKNTH
jgi:hypothetical protein